MVEIISDDDTITSKISSTQGNADAKKEVCHFTTLGQVFQSTKTQPLKKDEDFTVLFEDSAKLFCFRSNESKFVATGTGTFRIVQEKNTKQSRIIMYRERVLTICANHAISREMNASVKDGSKTTWVWQTPADMSEGSPTAQVFAAKFKNIEIGENFASVFEKCSKEASEAPQASPKITSFSNTDNSSAREAQTVTESTSPRLFSGFKSSGLSFTSFGSGTPSGFENNVSGKTFSGAGATLFGGSAKNSVNHDESSENVMEEQDIYVEPLVQLQSIKTSTGEEEEKIVFKERC